MNINVLSAVFKRNLVSYFSNPTGYVFIWLFVFLSAIAAFFPDEFFNANLANLDQLNKFFPFIMLFFVPAITMSIWADEVRQGTDELLLTMPATDFDIVLGKYLAAVSIYSISLLISAASNGVVLSLLGRPDPGLYVCTYLGYWLLGLSMLAVGMVASFLTRNLTVAYILGALFNAPLVAVSRIDLIPGLSRALAGVMRQWSFGGQCEEFGRGILSLSGCVYFLFIAAIMLYVCVILLGRRHWARGDDAALQAGHFIARSLSLAVMAAAFVFILQYHDVRRDATSEQLTALSPVTLSLLDNLKSDYAKARDLQRQIAPLEEVQKQAEKKALEEKLAQEKAAAKASAAKTSAAKPADPQSTAAAPKAEEKQAEASKKEEPKSSASPIAPEDAKKLADLKTQLEKLKIQQPVLIDAYVSPDVPESFVQTRINLLNVLEEFKRVGQANGMMQVNVHEINRFDKLAEVAKARYNIVPQEVRDTRNGSFRKENIFMGVAFTCGLEKVVLPFIRSGVPPEYELVRSLCTVTKQKRQKIGVLSTDAHVMGNYTMTGMSPEWLLIQELRKQYEVVQVNPADLMMPPKPGEEKRYDVLLAIQPSSLGPKEMDSFIAAVRAGQPTVIFEDPYFLWMRGIPGTYERRRPQNPMMGMSPESQQKGNIRALWQLLGIDFSDGGGEDYSPMGDMSPASGTEKVVWQRYNPYPKLGNTIQPEWVFIDPACGAKAPFCEEDSISSKLQHVFMIAPGFIDDTPAAVKRLVAKWHNKQYARQLTKKINGMIDDIAKAEKNGDADKVKELNEKGEDLQEEYNQVSAGGSGKQTVEPSDLHDGTNLEDLISKLLGKGRSGTVGDLVSELRNRYPVPADDGSDDGRAVLLTEDAAKKLRIEADKLSEQAKSYQVGATRSDRLARAAELKGEAAKLKEAAADLTYEGVKGVADDGLLKLRIMWYDDAADLKNKAAERLAKTGQSQENALFDQENAEQMALSAHFKELLASTKTVGDVVKYVQEVVALQLKDRKFTPLIQTGPGPDAGTISASEIGIPETFGVGGGLNPFRSLYYQPSHGQPFVLAAHITGKPRDRVASAPINVVLVADVEMVNDMFFELREQGTMPGQDLIFDFDNVTFALNALDSLAGDQNFLELRKRRPLHRTLDRFDERTAQARKDSALATEKQRKEHDEAIRNAVKDVEAKLKNIRSDAVRRRLGEMEIRQLVAREENNLRRQLDEKRTDTNTKFNAEIDRVDNERDAKIFAMRDTYKLWAVIVPPIPLLFVAAMVLIYRRTKEREGVSSRRLR